MKQIFSLSIIGISLLTAISCNSCHFSKGFSKDLSTTLSVKYNGFSIEKAYLTDENNQPLNDNTVHAGVPFKIIVNGIDGYQVENDKAYPGCEVSITNDSGRNILYAPDVFADQTGGFSLKIAADLAADYRIPVQAGLGKTFHVKARIFDKKNAKNEIVATADVVLQP